MLKVRI